ncbi:MAG: type II secretion system GspH family protein [Acidobacteria bacterium]|nr:type II secretion system GspH family protein [Acidobacteriota bacterium]
MVQAVGSHGTNRPARREGGFTTVELIVVLAVAGILASLAVAQNRAQTAMRVTTSRQLFAQYLEKARLDSKRRRATNVAQMSGVRITAADRYLVTLDFTGTGTVQTREVALPDGVTFDFVEPVLIRFDSRGRPTDEVEITLKGGYGGDSPPLVVSEQGNVASGGEAYHLPDDPEVTVNATDITGTTNVDTKLKLRQ